MFTLLSKNHPLLLLLSAQTISNFGDWLHILALFALTAFKWDAGPLAMSGITLCMVLPSILFGSPAGIIADRYSRKVLMIAADLIRSGCVLGIAFAASLWQVYLFLLLLGTFSAIFYPAKSGVLRQIITENQIQAAVSTSEMINNSAKIIGPAAGGALISFIGIKGAFYLDVLSFLLSALLLTGIKVPKLEARAETGSSESPSITEGLRYIIRFPVLKLGLIVLCSMMLALQISDSQVMILLKEIKHATINFAGWCIAASGLGMLAASAIFTKIKIGEKLTALIFSPAILGAGFIAVSIGTGWPTGIIKIVFPCIFFLMGFSFTMAVIPFDVMVQKKTPETHTGRVFGAINSASTLAVLTGILAGGGLSEWLGVGITFQISGGASCLLALITLIAIRKIERKNPDVTEGIERTS